MEEGNPFTKSKTIDPEVRAYVYSLVNALGGTAADESGKYVLGDDSLAVLRDLKRWLKLYDEKTNRLDVARCLAEANLVRGDLLPILSTWKENAKNDKTKARVALACFELLVPLTWPLEQEEMTVNHHRHTPYILQAQVKYKAGILHWETVGILRQAIRTALSALAMSREERTPRDEGIIKLVLYFLRNIASIRQMPNLPSVELENEVSRSSTIEVFRDQDVFAMLLTLCSNMGEDYNHMDVIILEIIFNLIKGVDVEKLWMNREQRTKSTVSEFKKTLAMEEALNIEAKKKGWSRHGRFGTMIWIKAEDEQMKAISGQDNLKNNKTAIFNMDANKKWNKPQTKRRDLDHSIHDFDSKETLSSTAAEQLRIFAEEFLDSGFNPLITHLRKAIEREAERLQPINYRQFFYVVAWFLKAERTRRKYAHTEAQKSKLSTVIEPESYGLVAAVLNQETFITLNRYMHLSWDEKAWQDLNASMRCFTEILLTVQDMAQSPLEDDQDIAENIQNRIFYEETTHDRVRAMLGGYKDQGLGYLDACTELSHVFLRMLERYSKENVDLQIRSKRKARRKKKAEQQATIPDESESAEQAQDESENEDVEDIIQSSKERKFDFKRFAAKFVSQSSVDTFIALLKFYKDLSVQQLKRIHRFLYRVAFKQEQAVLLYRVDIVALLYKIHAGPEGLPEKHELSPDFNELSKQIFRKMFKKIDQRPELMIEMLFSKIPSTSYYLEYGHDKQTSTSTRPAADLEIKNAASHDRSEQIGIVVTVLLRDHKQSLVDWVKKIITRAAEERLLWEAAAEAREDPTPSLIDLPPPEATYISIVPENEEIRLAMFKNGRLKLLMKLVGMVQEINDKVDTPDSTWIIPSHISGSHLQESQTALTQYSETPWTPDHEDDNPEDFLRRARKDIRREIDDDEGEGDIEAPRANFIDDSEGEDAVDGQLFPDNPREKDQGQQKTKRVKRKRDSEEELDSEEEAAKEERRRKRRAAVLENRKKFRSDAYIHDSDEESDEEKDREFFRKEAELRRKYGRKNEAAVIVGQEVEISEEQRRIMERLKGEIEVDGDSAERDAGRDDTDEDMSGDSTPPSSAPVGRSPLKDLVQGRDRAGLQELLKKVRTVVDGDSEDEVVRPVARRGGFVIDAD